MSEHSANLLRLYLPLLTHELADVRRQASVLLACSQGPSALAVLRRLTQDPDIAVCRQAHAALRELGPILGAVESPKVTARLFVSCLGPLRVSAGGVWLGEQEWSPADGGRAGWQKVQAAFAFLVHAGRHGATKRALGEAVWGGAFSASSLARTLTTLRQVLERACGAQLMSEALMLSDECCRLDPELYEADVDVFERAYAIASAAEDAEGLVRAAALYAQVNDLYAGPYMADILPGSGWMRQRRELLDSYYLIASERLAEDAFARSDYHSCILACLRALAAEPGADDIVSWLMRAYAQLGHYGELEYAFRCYLQTIELGQDMTDHSDGVVKTYKELIQGRFVDKRNVISTERISAGLG